MPETEDFAPDEITVGDAIVLQKNKIAIIRTNYHLEVYRLWCMMDISLTTCAIKMEPVSF